MKQKYPNLFSPINIGSLVLKNRIETAPVSVADLNWQGHLTKDHHWHYKLKALGGAAIVTLGEAIVHAATGKSHPLQVLLDDPTVVPSLGRAADMIRQSGAVASIELSHGGHLCDTQSLNGGTPVGPSARPGIKEMSEDLINEIADYWGAGAAVVKKAGFDMCMMHAGHGWLLAQFMSPLTNMRKDKFGGSLENRMRFPMMAIDRVRAAVGPDFPIEIRISGSELTEGGLTIDDTIEICKMIEDRVDLIHVSVGTFANGASVPRLFPTIFEAHGCNAPLAEAIKKQVKIPVVTVGGYSDPSQMEQVIADGKADIIAVGRGLLADPDLPKKAKFGREDEIVPCIRCIECLGGMYARQLMKCTVNPIIGREFDSSVVKPATDRKKVLIAGGGPAGMQAAITASERGHEVTLCEKTDTLGGTLKFASHVSFKADLMRFIDYQIRRVNSLAVKVKLNTEVTPSLVESESPDVLIIAVGGEPIVPEIPGIDKKNVIMATDIHKKGIKIGKNVVVIGGGQVGCETALHLAQQGSDVTILEMMDDVAIDANPLYKSALMIELNKFVTVSKGTRCIEITDKGAMGLVNGSDKKLFKADSVIIAVGMKSRSDAAEELARMIPEYVIIGDCMKPKMLMQAVHTGYDAAINIA